MVETQQNDFVAKAIQMQNMTSKTSQNIYKSNELFLRTRIHDIENLNLSDERDKLNIMARLWYCTNTWSKENISALAETESTEPERVAQREKEANIRRLDDVMQLSHPRLSGTAPPKPLHTRTAFVAELHRAVLGQETVQLMNEDFAAFLACTDGIQDPDFHRSGICGFGVLPATAATREDVAIWLRDLVFDEEKLQQDDLAVAKELQIIGGYLAGQNVKIWRGKPVANWRCYYLFSRRRQENDGKKPVLGQEDFDAEGHGWAWRIALHCDSKEEWNHQPLRIFDDIPEFLQWYGDWYSRVDEDEVRRLYIQHSPDSEF